MARRIVFLPLLALPLALSFACDGSSQSGDGDGDGDTAGDGDGDTGGDGDGDANTGDGDGDAPGDGDGDTGCSYPIWVEDHPNGVGDVMPNISWDDAVFTDGSVGAFSFEAFLCDPAYAGYDTMTVVMNTEWCPNCPAYVQQVGSLAAQLEANNSLLVWSVMQNNNYGPISSAKASQYISSHIPSNIGIRTGSASLVPFGALDNMYSFIPNGFVVRKRDMQVIAHQETAGNFLPYVQIAADPENDWSSGLAPFVNMCDEGADESYEPNNTPEQAATLTGGEDFTGGICDQNADYYFIDVAGPWRIELLFTHATGDLDLHRLNEAGESVQQAWSVTDNEEMEATGPSVVAVVGYTGASAPYEFILTDLSAD